MSDFSQDLLCKAISGDFYSGVGFFAGVAARAGDGFAVGEGLTGDSLGAEDSLGVGDVVSAGAGFLTGTVAEATICHWPLRRINVSMVRNS
jgi:hypothetical protein